MSSKDGRDKMAQDQETNSPSLIQPVVEEFDMSVLDAEVNAADAELSDVPFVEVNSTDAAGDTEEPDSPDQPDAEVVEASADAGEDSEEASETPEAEDADDDGAPSELTENSADDTQESDEAEEAEPVAEEQPVSDEPAKKPGTPDKALQKLQQRQSAFERDINDKFDQLTTLLSQQSAEPEAKGQDEQPPANAPENEPAHEADNGEFEAALAELQEIAADNDEFDEPTKADLSKAVNALTKALTHMKAPKAPAAPEIEGLDEVREFIQAERNRREAEASWQQFSDEHGYDGRPLWKQALADAARIYPDAEDQSLKVNLAQRYFYRRVEKRAEGDEEVVEKPVEEAPQPPVKKPVKPVSSKPRKPAIGTQTTPPGARGAGQKKTGKLPPIFTP